MKHLTKVLTAAELSMELCFTIADIKTWSFQSVIPIPMKKLVDDWIECRKYV